MKKLARELDLETILEALNNKKDEEYKDDEYHNDIVGFLHFYNIENGKQKVSKRLLYRLYKQWSDNPLESRQFNSQLGIFIESSNEFYLINQKSLDLAASAYRNLQKRHRDKTKQVKYKKHFENFLKFYNIKEGTQYVPWFVLYHLYDKWVYNNKTKNVLTEMFFAIFCDLYFPRKRKTSTFYWYAVDPLIFDVISRETMQEMVDSRNAYVEKHKKRKKPKIKKQISESSGEFESKD